MWVIVLMLRKAVWRAASHTAPLFDELRGVLAGRPQTKYNQRYGEDVRKGEVATI